MLRGLLAAKSDDGDGDAADDELADGAYRKEERRFEECDFI
jgi:hypothetical protein